jgi:hypothetical protein
VVPAERPEPAVHRVEVAGRPEIAARPVIVDEPAAVGVRQPNDVPGTRAPAPAAGDTVEAALVDRPGTVVVAKDKRVAALAPAERARSGRRLRRPQRKQLRPAVVAAARERDEDECNADYTLCMLERATMRTLPVLNRAADYVPVAPACCNACRTCTTSNVLGLLTGGAVALVGALRRVVRG